MNERTTIIKVFADMLRENPLFVTESEFNYMSYICFKFKLGSECIKIIIDKDSIRFHKHIIYRRYNDIPKHIDTVGVGENGYMYINEPLCIFDIIHGLPKNIQEYIIYNINVFSTKEKK